MKNSVVPFLPNDPYTSHLD